MSSSIKSEYRNRKMVITALQSRWISNSEIPLKASSACPMRSKKYYFVPQNMSRGISISENHCISLEHANSQQTTMPQSPLYL